MASALCAALVAASAVRLVAAQEYNPVCEDAQWKDFAFLRSDASDFSPLVWHKQDWIDYAKDEVLPSIAISIAFLALVIATGGLFILYRLVRCFCICCSCCSFRGKQCCEPHGSVDLLRRRRMVVLKFLVVLFAMGAIAMTIASMVMLKRPNTVTVTVEFWRQFDSSLAYLTSILNALFQLAFNIADGTSSNLQAFQALVNYDVQPAATISSLQCAASYLQNAAATVAAANVTAVCGLLLTQLPSTGGTLLTQLSGLDTAVLPAVSTGLPLITNVQQRRSDIIAAATNYQSALAALPSSQPSGGASAQVIQDLAAAQAAMTVQSWLNDIDTTVAALTALQAEQANHTAGRLAAQGSTLSQTSTLSAAAARNSTGAPALGRLAVALNSTTASTGSGTLQCLTSSAARLNTITNTILNFTYLVPIGGNTSIPMVQFLQVSSSQLSALAGANISAAVQQQVAALLPSLTALSNTSAVASAATAYGDAVDQLNGSGLSDLIAYLNVTIRPALQAISVPVQSVGTALAAYTLSANTTTYAALQSAASNASTAMQAAAPQLQQALPATTPALASGAADLPSSVSQLSTRVHSARNTTAQLLGTLASGNATLVSFCTSATALAAETSSLGSTNLTSLIVQPVQTVMSFVQNLVTNELPDILAAAQSAASDVQSAAQQAQTDLVDKIVDKRDTYYSDSMKYTDVVYGVWMGLNGLYILLILVVVVAALRNFPGGIATLLIPLWLLMCIGLVMTGALGSGQFVLHDTCYNIEPAAVDKAIYEDLPKAAMALRYYLIHDRNLTLNQMIDQVVGVDVDSVLLQVQEAQGELVDSIYNQSSFVPGAKLNTLLTNVTGMVNRNLQGVQSVLSMVSYEAVNPYYRAVKAVICCPIGSLAYDQWWSLMAACTIGWAMTVALIWETHIMDAFSKAVCWGCDRFPAPPKDEAFASPPLYEKSNGHSNGHSNGNGSQFGYHAAPQPVVATPVATI